MYGIKSGILSRYTKSKLKVVPFKHALTPVYFIFSVMQSTFLSWRKKLNEPTEKAELKGLIEYDRTC